MKKRTLRKRYGRATSVMTRRFEVSRIRLDSGGYDSGGRYYGTGAPLFHVYDKETEKEEIVRASSAKAAREKVMSGIFGPPARNPLHAEIKKTSKEMFDELMRNGGRMTPVAIAQYRPVVESLAARVRPHTANDLAWEYYDKDLADGRLHGALGMVAGAEERMK